MKKILLFLAAISFMTESYSQASFNTGVMEISVNQYGRIRLFTPDGVMQLQRASILVGTTPTTVFDYQNDAEELEPTVLVANPAMSDFEIYGAYDNTYSGDPPAVIETINAYGWNNASYALIKFNVLNDESNQMDASIGLDIIPELNEEYGYDTVTYNNALDVIRFHRGSQENMGMKLLSASLSSLYSFEWYDGYEVDADYWNWMNNGSLQSQYVSNTVDGPVTITSQDPVTLAPGESIDVIYAMALGATEEAMLASIAEAEEMYNSLFVAVEENAISKNDIFLIKNYPNPFNHSTAISYQLKEEGFVSLKVFDACGKEVAALVNSIQSSGLQEVIFDSEGLSEGVYYYTFKSDNLVITNKMVISR